MKNINKLDKQEIRIEKALERGSYLSASNLAKTRKLFQEAASGFREMNQTKRITIRVRNEDLIRVKANAKKGNIPYQTLLNALIRQYAQNQVVIQL